MHSCRGKVGIHPAELLRTGQPYPQVVVEGEVKERIEKTHISEGFSSKEDSRLADDAFTT
jgi:hypothetical protein